MKIRTSIHRSIILITCYLLSYHVNAQSKRGYSSLAEALASGGYLTGNTGPQNVTWTSDGSKYAYSVNDGIRVIDPQTSKEEQIFSSKGITFPGSTTRFEFQSFQWSHDAKQLVFKSNFRPIYRNSGIADYYIYDIAGRQLNGITKDAHTAELSPDGLNIGYERNGNLYTYNLSSRKENKLTNDSTSDASIFNGHFDWVYEEEFGLTQAWNWSPDSKHIAFWQFDEHKVPDFQMTNFEGGHSDYIHIPIPQVGDTNPSVKIGVIDITSGKKVWLSPDETGDYYIPRIYWTSDPDTLALMTLNRTQNHLKLYFFNIKTGEYRVVMEEQNNTWVSIFNSYINVNDFMYFPEGSKEFFWISDRSGYYHIYRYGYYGKLLGQVTKGNWDVLKITGIDAASKKIYYLSSEGSGLEQQLYSIRFDGTEKAKLSDIPGYHDVNMSPNTRDYIDSYSNTKTPVHVILSDDKGKTLKTLEDNHDVNEYLQNYNYSTPELFRFKTSDGVSLDGYLIKPPDFDPHKKYPVVMTVYGGPESHDVYNSFSTDMWSQWLAQNGYIVVDVNNRGTANYGSSFTKVVYKQLGRWESDDFVETAKYLGTLPFVDTSKMAIMGTSYGGYGTIYTLLTHPGVFKAGIANSPVTDWRLYDDIYTERYMGLLQDNKQGYDNSSAVAHAENLKDHLLLIHSMSDDNVHPANTMQLLTALTNAGKDVDLRIYPPGAHGAAYNSQSALLIYQVSFEYLEKYLKSGNR